MPRGKREIVDITRPAVTVAEGENKDSVTGDEEVEVHAGYNLRRGPRPAEMELQRCWG